MTTRGANSSPKASHDAAAPASELAVAVASSGMAPDPTRTGYREIPEYPMRAW